MLRNPTEDTQFALFDIMNRMLESEQIPEEWEHGLITKLPKKGDLSDFNKWRGITLLSVAGIVFNRTLLSRMRENQHTSQRGTGRISPQQKLYRPDHNFKNHNRPVPRMADPLTVNFVDFQKAFDSIIHRKLVKYRSRIWKKTPQNKKPPQNNNNNSNKTK